MKRIPFPSLTARSFKFLILGFTLVLMALPLSGLAQAYPQDFRFTQVPNPLSADNLVYPLPVKSKPSPGASWTDGRFGTALTRVTQSSTLRHEYSRFDPFNCQRTLLLLMDATEGEWRVYRTQSLPYDQTGNLVRTIDNLAEMRWDPQDSDTLWGFRDFSIIKLDVATGEETLIKNFAADPAISPILLANPLIYHITCMNEGESSRDQRFWALALQNGDDPAHPEWSYIYKYLFTWDRMQNQVLGTHLLSLDQGQRLDWVGMSTLGNWVLIAGESEAGVPPNWGLIMASRDFSVLHELHQNTGHADVGLDTWGREVIVMQNAQTDYVDLMPLDLQSRPVNSLADYADNPIQPLVILYYNSESPISMNSAGIHVSCNHSGYALISTYIQPNLADQNWLDRCLALVRLDPNNTQAVYLAKTYNTTQQYWEETHATISNDGSRIIWVDSWGQSVPEPETPQLTLTQLDMPPNWQNQFPPPVTTDPATSITTNSAVLNATVNPNGDATHVVFEYGTDTNYGNQITASQSPLSGTGDQAASATLTGLSSNTTYHYCAKATNSGGTSAGEDRAFTTEDPCPNCSGANPQVQDLVFSSGTDCQCVGTESMTIGPNVTIQKDAKATFKSPSIRVTAPVKAEQGSQVKMGK